MRSLLVVLSVLILGGLVVIGLAAKVIADKSYQAETSEDYLHYSGVIAAAIEQSLTIDNTQADDRVSVDTVLKLWQKKVGDELIALKMVDNATILAVNHEGEVSRLFISEQRDEITIVVPLGLAGFKNKALSFSYRSEYSQEYMFLYYLGIVAGYLMMLFIVSLIAWAIHRYISQIRIVTQSVASGNFDLRMASSRISTLQSLADDINAMVSTIEEKTSDNLILTGAIHHELRIPMTRMRLALDMALHEKSFELVNELLVGMDEDLEELASLTEKLLTLSRMRLNSIATQAENIQFPLMLDQIIQSFDNDIITYQVCDFFTLKGNNMLVERAIVNVIENAVKYCQCQVNVSGTVVNSEFVINIDDDGIGIEKELRELVLKPFYRTDKSRSRKTGGFGLGLAITDMVLKETGGQIMILSSKLGGTTVRLVWPVL